MGYAYFKIINQYYDYKVKQDYWFIDFFDVCFSEELHTIRHIPKFKIWGKMMQKSSREQMPSRHSAICVGSKRHYLTLQNKYASMRSNFI